MRLPRHFCLSVGVGLALLADQGHATKLDKPICDDLKVEQGLLQQKGIPGDMAKGPDWAKTNLSRDRLKEIERLIHVEEQLAFRCPQPRKPPQPGLDEDGNVMATPAKPGTANAALDKVKAQKAKAKAAAADPIEGPAQAKKGANPSSPAPATRDASSEPIRKQVKTAPAATASANPPEGAAVPKKISPKPKPKTDDAYTPPPEAAAKSVFSKTDVRN